jgi:hypothetical protein
MTDDAHFTTHAFIPPEGGWTPEPTPGRIVRNVALTSVTILRPNTR